MRKFALAVFAAVFAAEIFAAPFVTPDMIKRNGLTDEQYETLWKMGKSPRIDIGTMRQLMFRANRYGNVTNWLDICGKTNDFAKLSFKLQGDNFQLEEIRKELTQTNSQLRVELSAAVALAMEYENDARTTREIRKAAKRTEKNLQKVLKSLEQAKKKAADEDEAALWTALISILEGKDPNDEEA